MSQPPSPRFGSFGDVGSRGSGGRHLTANIDDLSRYKAMVNYLYGRISASQWLAPSHSPAYNCRGVLLRKSRGAYVGNPDPIPSQLLAAVQKLNVEVAFTMHTETTQTIISTLEKDQTEIVLRNGSQLQVVDSLIDIASGCSNVKKFQYACLVRRDNIVLVWHDELQSLLGHAADLEGRLLSLIWGTGISPFTLLETPTGPGAATPISAASTPTPSIYRVPREKKTVAESIRDVTLEDEESGNVPGESLSRPLILTSSVFVGLGVMLIIFLLLGLSASDMLFEAFIDGDWTRMALLATVPFIFLLGLFFIIVIFGNIFQAFGPITSIKTNSRFYSAIKPSISRAYAQGFSPPHITIQMPVYKESLDGVIIPTVTSLKAAISHYESHGGTASIFVNDDGMRYISPAEAQARQEFYHDNNIGWVARPQNNQDGYVRKGKFKKASNMNFALNFSNRVEDILLEMIDEKQRNEKTDVIDDNEEEAMYQAALDKALGQDKLAVAAGNIRVGEYILIIDSDTRVPVDCLLYGAAEMFLSPEVAIVQHAAGVMQVACDYFENGITYFTNLVYTTVRFAVGSGEVAPFVGHNAFLRWKAVQSVGVKEENGYVAYWSESHVSEDFDIALRLQIAGNVVRLASYHDGEFKEGVSLTIYDELARWEKYAYGCNELVFHPMHTWLWRGPFTPLFGRFLWSNMQLSSKITILGYIVSYYSISSGFPLTLLNYFLIGWFNGELDKFYMESWKVFVSLIVVFNGMSNVCLAILRYRLGEKSLWGALLENFKWMPMFTVFFGGLSFHLNLALLAHMFHIDMQWGATAKEVENSNFFKEIPKIFKSFKWMYITMVPIIGAMIYLGCYAPRGWEIQGATAVVPLAVQVGCHILMPFLLNPALMVFNY
ncbi:glycosyl transferase family group 2-domain-containing protein [Lineolata rhizophorae]|uniref:Glycosyl transferase family group 2-domain-containing protein n=1 Tax=Lineolata rhizophorae TaxID=578093 RepID=A0A6A6NSF3_9PEZI|nr:glycosyl transferase family group 2-domain-containing protein [Lineolata rhizophorae]